MNFTLLSSLLVLTLWNVYCIDESVITRKPVFTEYPRDAFPLHRQQLRLFCRADGEPVVSITWYKDGKVVETQRDKPGTSNRITKPGELLFLSFSVEDEGQYYCNASNIHGWTRSPSALVKAAFFDASGASGPESKSANLGQTILLECTPPAGLPVPAVHWKHNNQKIIDSSRIRIMGSGLRIEAARRQDAGSYQCLADNSAGRWESKSATLTVRRKPRFKFTPMSKQAVVGDAVEFQCLASEDPNSTILWRREGNKIIQASLIDRKTLRIEHVKLSDAGDYICEAKNVAGNVEAVAHLSVVSPPIFVITPEDKTVPLGSQVSFDCLTSGSPPPSVRWLHNKFSFWVPKPNEKPIQAGRFQIFPNGTLSINSTLLSDVGLFECKASQKAGIVKSSAQLLVETSGVISLPLIEVGPQNRTLYQGMIATLPCHSTVLQYTLRASNSLVHSSVDTFTPIVTQWFFNGSTLSSNSNPRVVILNSGSLQINALRVSDTGLYTCEVEIQDFSAPFLRRSTSSTSFLQIIQSGSSESSMYLPSGEENEMLLPDPPKDVRVTSIGDTWVLLELADDQSNMHTIHRRDITSGVFRTGLQVEAAEFNASSGWRIMESSVTSTSVHVNGLLPQTGYHFLVRYINRYGVGRPFILNRLVITKMPEPARDYVPTELVVKLQSVSFSPVHIRAISPSELLAEWFLCGPSDTLSLITGFKAAYMSVPMSRCITSGAKSSGFYIKESITHYSKMDHDSCTYRDESVESLLDSYDDDLTPCSLLGISKQQSLDWNPPSFLNGEAFDYYVHSGVNSTNVKMAIGNLRPFMCYAVRIEAFVDHPDHNRIFAQKSQVSVSLTHDSTPTGAPQVTNVYWLKNGTVLQLDWNPPNEWERGGLLTGYSLRILSTAPKLSRTVNMGAEKSSFHIYNLDPSSNYTLYLSAVTCHGEGVRSLPVYIFAYPTRGHFPEASLHSSHNPIIDPNQFESGNFFRKVLYDGRSFYPGISASQTLADHTNSKHTGVYEEKLSLTREPWFIVSAVMFSVLWVLICLGLIICGRHRNERQRRRHGVLDVMDVEIIAKNGRLGTSDSTQAAGTVSPSMYMGGFMASTEAEAASLTVVDPLSVNAALLSDRNHTPKSCNPVFGDKSYANGLTHAMNAPYSVSINHTFSMSGDGNLQSVPAYIPQYSLGTQMLPADILKNHPYNNSSTMVPNISASSGGQMLPSGNHCSSDLLQGSGTPILPNGCLSLALSHGSQNQAADLSSEDHATPYASVSVIQQMVFDHMPMDYSAVQQGRGKQLSLAEIIPPPPDYPPPSLPSFSPVPHHFTSWSLGEAPCSGSGEDSAYSDFQQSSQHQGGCGPSVSNHNWLTSQPESNSALPTSSHSLSKTSGLSSEWPNHESLSTPHSTDQHNLFAHHPSTSLSTIQPSHVAC